MREKRFGVLTVIMGVGEKKSESGLRGAVSKNMGVRWKIVKVG